MKKAVVYVRVSSDEQVKGHSLDEQERKCKHFIEAHGFECSDVYREEGVSGGKKDRPELSRLFSDAREGKFDAIVFLKIDRLSRDLKHFLSFVEELNGYGVEIQCVQEAFDTSTHTGRLQINILASFAEYERDLIRERSMMGRIASMRKGIWHGSPPFGYDKDENKKLVINEVEAEAVKRMYNLFVDKDPLEKMTLHKVQSTVNSWNIPTKKPSGQKKVNGATFWAPRTIGRLLSNPVYIGEKIFRQYTSGTSANCVKKERPESDRIKIKVPAIIDIETFDLVQRELGKNKLNARRNRKKDTMLARLVYCGICGRKFTPSRKSLSKFYYYCLGRFKVTGDKKCPSHGYRSHSIEEPVWDLLKSILSSPELIEEKLKDMRTNKFNLDKIRKGIEEIKNKIEKISTKRKKLLNLYLDKHLTKGEYVSNTEDVDLKIKSLNDDLVIEQSRLLDSKDIMSKFDEVKEQVKKIQTNIESATYETKIAIAHLLIKRIDIDESGGILKVLIGLPLKCAEVVGLQDKARIY